MSFEPTDVSCEPIDIISPATGEVLQQSDRHSVHADGQWHQVFHCLVLRPSAGTIILQRRAHNKKAFPGLLDLSVTGHLSSGETPLDGLREYEEELGVPIKPEALIRLGTRLLADDNGEGQNRELVHLFFVRDDRPLTDYRPPAHEVDGLVEIAADDLLRILADPTASAQCSTVASTAPTEPTEESITQHDMVEGANGYWVVLGVMAQRALSGQTLLAI